MLNSVSLFFLETWRYSDCAHLSILRHTRKQIARHLGVLISVTSDATIGWYYTLHLFAPSHHHHSTPPPHTHPPKCGHPVKSPLLQFQKLNALVRPSPRLSLTRGAPHSREKGASVATKNLFAAGWLTAAHSRVGDQEVEQFLSSSLLGGYRHALVSLKEALCRQVGTVARSMRAETVSSSTVCRVSVKTASTATNIAPADFSASSFIADSSDLAGGVADARLVARRSSSMRALSDALSASALARRSASTSAVERLIYWNQKMIPCVQVFQNLSVVSARGPHALAGSRRAAVQVFELLLFEGVCSSVPHLSFRDRTAHA